MTGVELREAVRALITSHPHIRVSDAGHAAHAERFMTANGEPIGMEPKRVRFQNIWLRADSVRVRRFDGIASRYYDKSDFHRSKPNHDLFGEKAFKDCDLICFKVTELWQAVRVILEVAGEGCKA